MHPSVDDVRKFWQNNPLWTGESAFTTGSAEFFAEHRDVYIADCFAGIMDERIFPLGKSRQRVLDLGCGPGFWTVEIGRRGCDELWACDLTDKAIELARRRCEIYGCQASFRVGNAESLAFDDGYFSHVNCLGVIHHTPDTEATVGEIARVLRVGGTASVSVYYRNILLRWWPALNFTGRWLRKLGIGLKGRGREGMVDNHDVDEIVRLYDGAENPIGKSYSRHQFLALLEPHFHVREIYFHFFPARALGMRIPAVLHRLLDRHLPFMIYASLEKKGK
jgi:SAM-dependent methyltransferase